MGCQGVGNSGMGTIERKEKAGVDRLESSLR